MTIPPTAILFTKLPFRGTKIEVNGYVIVCGPYMEIMTVNGESKTNITNVLQYMGLTNEADLAKDVRMVCKSIHEGSLNESDLPEEIRNYVSAYRQWLKESLFVHEHSELPLYSSLHHYAGTLHLVGTLPNIGRVLIDIETGRSINPAIEIEVGAKAILWNHNFQEKPLSGSFVLQLRNDGTHRFQDLSEVNEFLFLDALHLWRWKQTHKRQSKAE